MNIMTLICEKYSSVKRKVLETERVEILESKINFKLPFDYREFIEGYTGFENFIV